MRIPCCLIFAALVGLGVSARPALAVDLATLGPGNAAELALAGKEADAVYGDYVLQNDRIVAVVAGTGQVTGRSCSRWAIPNVAGCLIDLTLRDAPNDQLVAWYPGPLRFKPDGPQRQEDFVDEATLGAAPARAPRTGPRLVLALPAFEIASGRALEDLAALPESRRGTPQPSVEIAYVLEDGWPYVRVETTYHNPTSAPLQFDPEASLRLDPGVKTGLAFDGRLFWAYDPWFGAAYGILTPEARMQARSPRRIRILPDGPDASVIPPGETRTYAQLVIPAADLAGLLARAAEILDLPTHALTISLREPTAAATGAQVEAWQNEALVSAARADARGVARLWLTEGFYTLRVQPPGCAVHAQPLQVAGPAALGVDLPAAGMLRGRVRDAQGNPLPCRVALYGADGTPTPDFFPATGAERVRNRILTPDGDFLQALAPGRYTALIARGPEYDAVVRPLEIAAGAETVLAAELVRSIASPGWISASFHNHTTVSGEAEIFYINDYHKDPRVDGDSFASPRGRVLELLAEHIEFAPATEHDRVFSYASALADLDGAAHLATCPGIGYTAGRRHARSHLNVFPVAYDRFRLDGGTPQRPEHVSLLAWILRQPAHADRLIIASKPTNTHLDIQRGMDGVEIQSLEPLLEGKPLPGRDGKILEWVDRLQQGYRITGIAGTNVFDNAASAGALRNYLQSPVDEPAAVRTADVAAAVRRGAVVMTTGPFLEVAARAADAPEGEAVIPGGCLASADGRVSLHVRVQAARQTRIDRVQVLANGTRVQDLRRATHADLFADGPLAFDQRLPLELEKDAFLLVVASGTGMDLDASENPAHASCPQIAVSNPIYVDRGGNGFTPHSPFDDRVSASLEWVHPLLAAPDAEPGEVLLRLRNTGATPAEDRVRLDLWPSGAMRVVGEAEPRYAIPPGQEATLLFRVAFTPEFLAQTWPVIPQTYTQTYLRVIAPRSGEGAGRQRAESVPLVDHALAQQPPVADIQAVPSLVAGEMPFPLRTRSGALLGTVRWALAGDALAVHAAIAEPAPARREVLWQGSCLEVFGATPGKRPIGHVYLVPQAEEAAPTALVERNGKIQPAPHLAVTSAQTKAGYELTALIPLADLAADAGSGRVLLECRAHALVPPAKDFQSGTVFRSGAPHVDHATFGRFRVAERVQVRLEAGAPLSLDPQGPPGVIRATLRNCTGTETRDTLVLLASPADAARLLHPDPVPYVLAPGAQTTVTFEAVLTATNRPGAVAFTVPRSPRGDLLRQESFCLPVAGYTLRLLPRIETLQAIPAALAECEVHALRTGDTPLAHVRLGLAGDHLAIRAEVADSQIARPEVVWQGSCVEVFGAAADSAPPGQVILAPASGDTPAAALRVQGAAPEPDADVQVSTEPTPQGYALSALIPLAHLHVPVDAKPGDSLLLEVQVTAFGQDKSKAHASLFGSTRAYRDASHYGRLILVER